MEFKGTSSREPPFESKINDSSKEQQQPSIKTTQGLKSNCTISIIEKRPKVTTILSISR